MARLAVQPGQVRVLFMGSPEFAVPSLDALVRAGFPVVAAVSQPDRPAGRGGQIQMPAVKQSALQHGIEVFQPESLRDENVRARLVAYDADVYIVAAYGKILPRAVLALPKRGCLNVHGSLLPRWRGPSPIAAAILAGDTESGISIMELVAKMDAGPVISQVVVPLSADATTGSVETALSRLGAAELVRVLPGWYAGELSASPQDESQATYCRLITKEDGLLRRAMTAEEAARAVRAYNPWPGAAVEYRESRLAIWAAHTAPGDAAVGAIRILDRRPAIGFSGGWLVLDEVQRAGAKRLTGGQFVNGERGALAAEVGLHD
jgi:methionyl-tRNA formyltransferase